MVLSLTRINTALRKPGRIGIRFSPIFLFGLITLYCSSLAASQGPVGELFVQPAKVRLSAESPEQQLLAMRRDGDRLADRTRDAVYQSNAPAVAVVDADGLIRMVSAGKAEITIVDGDKQATIEVTAVGPVTLEQIDFQLDVQPVFTRLDCNSGPCHGKQRGQNGFQLSLLGFDSDFDYAAVTKEAQGRRVFFASPEESLLLRKPTQETPHGGGKRLQKPSREYQMLRDWIAAGAPRSRPGAPELVRITVEPSERILAHHEQQQLLVTAHYSDGSTRDVTRLSQYQSNEEAIVAINERGLLKAGNITGDAALMTRYMGQFAVCRATVPLSTPIPTEVYAALPRHNLVDEHLWPALQRLQVTPSDPAPDHKFLRRAYLDIIGRVPTVEEATRFLDDPSPERRVQLIDELLGRPEYADFWANKWTDLLRPNPYRVGIKATLNYDTWIRDSFRRNQPYDQFVRELLTAQGGTFHNGAVTLFRDRRSPDELTTIVSQLFLGTRLECAKCHHHPFEVWGQEDFYQFAAYFAKVGRKGTGLSPPISGSEEYIFNATSGTVQHPLTGVVLQPEPLFGEAPAIPENGDPRVALAAWMTSKENHLFSQTMANRVWADLMGVGLVEPVDDLRATNPASNEPLLKALGQDFADHDFDIKHLIRTIATSYAYGLSSLPSENNSVDTRNYSRHYRKRLSAESLLDSICQITEVPENFAAMPPGSRATELWTHRVNSLFLDAFGRPDPNQDPPCERTSATTVVQALHLMNSEGLFAKVTNSKSLAAQLAESERTPAEIVTHLYLAVYSRRPTPEELDIGVRLYDNTSEADAVAKRRTATEDLLWAMLNTPEFVFKD